MMVIDVTHTTDQGVYNDRPQGDAGKIACCVIHHTGGTDSLKWLSGGHGVSVHKLLTKGGTIYKIVPEAKRAWHAGESEWGGRSDFNDFSIGYEVENRGDGVDIYTNEQYNALAATLCYDTALYHIPDSWIVDHKTIAIPAGRKNDPDPTFDHERLWKRMAAIRAAWPFAIEIWQCNR